MVHFKEIYKILKFYKSKFKPMKTEIIGMIQYILYMTLFTDFYSD